MLNPNLIDYWMVAILGVIGGLVVIDILWLIVRLSWAWIDDEDTKGNSIAKYYALYIWKTDEYNYRHNEADYWIGMLIFVGVVGMILWALVTFYLITCVIGILILIAVLARFVRRLSKKFKKHIADIDAHKPNEK